MKIYEEQLNDELLEKLIAMSADWETENSTYGYRRNTRSDIEPNRIFLAVQDGEILGYLSFIHVSEDKIASVDEYWGDDGDAPQWRQEKHIGTRIKV